MTRAGYTACMGEDTHTHGHRLERLEHATGFAERHIEILSGEVAELNKAVLGLTRRLAQLESRLLELNERVGEDAGTVPPPHSAGPDIPREPL